MYEIVCTNTAPSGLFREEYGLISGAGRGGGDAATTAARTAALHFARRRGRFPWRHILTGGDVGDGGQVRDLAAGGVGNIDSGVVEEQSRGAVEFDA